MLQHATARIVGHEEVLVVVPIDRGEDRSQLGEAGRVRLEAHAVTEEDLLYNLGIDRGSDYADAIVSLETEVGELSDPAIELAQAAQALGRRRFQVDLMAADACLASFVVER